MAHSCPGCDDLCYCDMEDAFSGVPADCTHVCDENDPERDFDWNDFEDVGTHREG